MKVLLSLFLMLMAPLIHAENFPSRGLRLIVPFAPGSGSDVVGRALAAKLGEQFGQTVTVENREGAAGLIAAKLTLSHPADGYTLMLAASPFVISPLLYGKPPYDPVTDFIPLGKVAMVPNVVLVTAGLPAHSMKEFIAYAKANPGKLNFASSGKGTPSQLETELLKANYGLEMTEVAYKNIGQGMTDLIAGEVSMFYCTLAAAMPHIKSGRARALAVGGAKRSPSAPEVPTMAQALDAPGYESYTWYGLVVVAGTPAEVLNRLRAETGKAVQSKEFKDRIAGMGAETVLGGGEEFAQQMRTESQKWAKLIKKIGLKAD
ncbi:MAG: Bug family tripartite tricarboxylate transporter substrate binding protein [Burkholderiales bacterium]